MQGEPEQPLMQVEQEHQLLMPHDYRFRDAVLDSLKGNKVVTVVMSIVTVVGPLLSITTGFGDVILAFSLWFMLDAVLLGYASINRLDQERRAREVALLERARRFQLDTGKTPIPANLMPVTRRMVVSIRPVLRHNKVVLLTATGVILASSLLLTIFLDQEAGIACGLSSTMLFAMAGGLMLLKEIALPNEQIRREIEANQTLRQLTSDKERANLKGSLSMDVGSASDERAGGLSMSQEKGAISSVERDPEG